MARAKRYLDTDVLTEAKRRILHVLDTFDSVVVMFSGGKDSLTVLHLVRQVYQEQGIRAPLNVVFRDEELIPQTVVDFVDGYRQLPWVKMLWFAVPMRSHKYILGVTREYIQWDPHRKHVRPIPPWAITLPPGNATVFDQYSMDGLTAGYFRGRIAFLTGVRADESLVRFRSVVNKLHENYINASDSPAAKLVKPIYDWTENDVFRFFYDNGIAYCPHYDRQTWAGMPLRVATPLHAESAKRFHFWRAVDPDFYEQVIRVFPEMLHHERYYREYDLKKVRDEGATSAETILDWILENIADPTERALALDRYESVMHRHRTMPESYPLRHIFNAFVSGGFKREILPAAKGAR